MKLMRHIDSRIITECFFKSLMVISLALLLSCLLLILATLIIKGAPFLTLEMITHPPQGGFYLGEGGGILNAILGSLYLATGATVLALLYSLPVVLYINIYLPRTSHLASTMRLCMDILWGIPSIVYGAFGFLIMTFFGLKASLGAGILTVSLFELPIMLRAMDEVVKTIPIELAEASYSLGATRFETAFKVVARQSVPGLMTGILLAFGRGIGDTACVLFTAGFTDRIPTSLSEPAATLPLAIFFQLGTPFPAVQGRAYASAVVLTVIILFISILSRTVSRRLSCHRIK